MALEAVALKRVFESNGVLLEDPHPQATPQKAVQILAAAGRADLATAEIRGPETRGDLLVYTLHRAVGTKGAAMPKAGRRTAKPAKPNAEMLKRLEAFQVQASELIDVSMCPALQSLAKNQGEHALVLPSRDVPWLG